MESINKAVAKYRYKQKKLKRETRHIKKNLPVWILALIFTFFVGFYIFEPKLSLVFGNTKNAIWTSTLLMLAIVFGIITIKLLKIRANNKESKSIGRALFRLMELKKEKNQQQSV